VRLLLDTHALLWSMSDDPQLGPTARELIIDPANDVLVSIVSLWEIVIKTKLGKLDASLAEVDDALDEQGFSRLGIALPHLETLTGLPLHHRDPFDHLLIAQAIAEGAVFVTNDRNAARYPVEVVRC